MSVGSVAVQLQFGLYVFGYLSKLAFHFMFIVVRLFVDVSSVRLACNGIEYTKVGISNSVSYCFVLQFSECDSGGEARQAYF